MSLTREVMGFTSVTEIAEVRDVLEALAIISMEERWTVTPVMDIDTLFYSEKEGNSVKIKLKNGRNYFYRVTMK